MQRTGTLLLDERDWDQLGWVYVDDGTMDLRDVHRMSAFVSVYGVEIILWAGRAWIDPADNCVKFRHPGMEAEIMPALQKLWDGAYNLVTIHGDTWIVWATPTCL